MMTISSDSIVIPILYIQMYIYISVRVPFISFFVIRAKLHYNGNFELIYCISLKTIL